MLHFATISNEKKKRIPCKIQFLDRPKPCYNVNIMGDKLPYYRKLTLVLIKVLEINAN